MLPLPRVHSYDEWSTLEEVIVGRVEHAVVPAWHPTVEATAPRRSHAWLREHAGRPFPPELVRAAALELDGLCEVLGREGVTVARPDPVDWSARAQTPDFGPVEGLYGAMPRDLLLVVGEELIEAPMAWRCRQHEVRAYRSLLKAYFQAGARWTAAPRPQLSDALYDLSARDRGYDHSAGAGLLTEHEPVFDAADFVRCGRDLFGQLSHVTNASGVRWLSRHLGPGYRIHLLPVRDPGAMHIDATFVPLAPGRALAHPTRLPERPEILGDWELLRPPPPTVPAHHPLYLSSPWLSMNVLSLDERRVVVEAEERPMVDFLRQRGFEPIPVHFRNFASFGGGFHCATLDVRRRGPLHSWF